MSLVACMVEARRDGRGQPCADDLVKDDATYPRAPIVGGIQSFALNQQESCTSVRFTTPGSLRPHLEPRCRHAVHISVGSEDTGREEEVQFGLVLGPRPAPEEPPDDRDAGQN